MYDAFYPGQVWLDTEGKRIQAHGGSVIYIDDTYYWYGENKEKTDGKNGIWHWGVRCYSSKDLYNWKDEGLIDRYKLLLRIDGSHNTCSLFPGSACYNNGIALDEINADSLIFDAQRLHFFFCERYRLGSISI